MSSFSKNFLFNMPGYLKSLDVPEKNLVTNKFGINFYETKKIRKIHEKVVNRYGFVLSPFNHVSYMGGGLAINVPPNYAVDEWMTLQIWSGGQTGKPMLDNIIRNIILKNEKYGTIWRWVKLEYVGGIAEETVIDVLSKFPYVMDIPFLTDVIYSGKVIMWPIYENTAFLNTMHDVVIYRNWDKILKQLNYWGY